MVFSIAHRPVGQLVAERPRRAAILEAFAVDYCCQGSLPLEEVCAAGKLDLEKILQALQADEISERSPGVNDVDWRSARLTDLIDHIQAQHHGYLRDQLPRLGALIDKVALAHRHTHPELRLLRRIFHAFADDLVPHMLKEEHVVFPAIKRREASADHGATAELRASLELMENEHDTVGAQLRAIRDLTDDYRPPVEACRSWRALLEGLADLEADMHLHIHKENNILFPRAMGEA